MWLISNLTFLILSANWRDEIVSLALVMLGLRLITIIMVELPTIESLRMRVILELRYGTCELPSPIDLMQCPNAVSDLLMLISSFSLFLFLGLLSTNDLSNFSLPAKSTSLSLVIVMSGYSAYLGLCMIMMLRMQWLRELISLESVRPVRLIASPFSNIACAAG